SFPGTSPWKLPRSFPWNPSTRSCFCCNTSFERSCLMTFFSVAEATKHLSIDAKTLHRWLADAHLPLQSHPRDGRKKGVSEEHMQTLARLHHRNAASLSEAPPVPIPSHVSPLPDALLALPETIATLQAQ